MIAAAVTIAILLLVSGGEDDPAPQAATETTVRETPLPSSGEKGSADGSVPGRHGGGKRERDRERERKASESPAARPEAASAPSFVAPVADGGRLPGVLSKSVGSALEGGELSLEDLKGTPFVITVLGSWCSLCGPQARLLQSEWERWSRRGVLYLALDAGEPASRARRLSDRLGLSFPVLSDPDGSIARDFEVGGAPETVFVSSRGNIVGRVIGGASIGQLELGSSAARSDQTAATQHGGVQLQLP